MSDTPKTDAVATYWHLMAREVAPASFARELERREAFLSEQIGGYERQLGILSDDGEPTIGSEIERLQGLVKELQASSDLRYRADMRAIKRWQEATGKDMEWPDHADLVLWLLGLLQQQVTFHCEGCGKVEAGYHMRGAWLKPPGWYQRTEKENEAQLACSRECIEKIAKATGKTGCVLPI